MARKAETPAKLPSAERGRRTDLPKREVKTKTQCILGSPGLERDRLRSSRNGGQPGRTPAEAIRELFAQLGRMVGEEYTVKIDRMPTKIHPSFQVIVITARIPF